MLRVFFILCFCVWFGVFCRFLQFFSSKGRFLEKFSGANFCFWVLVLGLCFLLGFCLCFCFIFGGSLPKVFGKNSLDVRSGVFKKIFGSELLFFGCRCWSCVCWCCSAYVFALCFGGSLPKMSG